MEELYAKLYDKYTALKKQKLLDEEPVRKREAAFEEYRDAMKDCVSDLQKQLDEQFEKLTGKQDELDKSRMDFLEDIRAKDSEIQRLKLLLAEKTDNNNSTAIVSQKRTPEAILENPTPISPAKKTLKSNNKAKRARLSESSSEEEAQEPECSRRRTCILGNRINESSTADMTLVLLGSLFRMNISRNTGSKRYSLSFSHEPSGYSFTLTWVEGVDKWVYHVSDLGTLEGVAPWIHVPLRFEPHMMRSFFEEVSRVIS